MRTSSLVTISLPSTMVRETEKIARKKKMTRSELLRTALRVYLEELDTQDAIRIADRELRDGTIKELKAGMTLADLMKK